MNTVNKGCLLVPVGIVLFSLSVPNAGFINLANYSVNNNVGHFCVRLLLVRAGTRVRKCLCVRDRELERRGRHCSSFNLALISLWSIHHLILTFKGLNN